MIAIIDYDAGNTFNVQKALQYIGLDAVLTVIEIRFWLLMV